MKCVNIKLWGLQGCFHYILNAPRIKKSFHKVCLVAQCIAHIENLITYISSETPTSDLWISSETPISDLWISSKTPTSDL